MIRIKIHKLISFVLFFIVIAATIFLPYFSQAQLLPAQVLPLGSETMRTLGRIATGFALYSPRLGKWEQFWGPVGSEVGHHH